MSNPPADLTRHVTPKTILAAFGTSVKDEAPSVVRCPVCQVTALQIYVDPVTKGAGRWLHCSRCLFSGDAIELYARACGIQDIEVALRMLQERDFIKLGVLELTPSVIKAYKEQGLARREQLQAIWREVSAGIAHPSVPIQRRMQRQQIWGGWTSRQQQRLRQFLGGGSRTQLTEIFKDPKLLPKKGYTTNLVVNYQDVPGRICGFHFLGEKENLIKAYPAPFTGVNEGGLGMLDALEPFENTVFATDDPELALYAHSRWFSDYEKPLKLVLFNEQTQLAWETITAKQVVFWNKVVSADSFSRASYFGLNGRVFLGTYRENTERSRQALWFDQAPDQLIAFVERHSHVWPEALAQWVVDPVDGVDELRLKEIIARMQPDAELRKTIIDAFPVNYRKRVKNVFEDRKTVKTCVVNGQTIVEDEQGWHVVNWRNKRELISDVVVRVTKEVRDENTGTLLWEGDILAEEATIPFLESIKVIEEQTRDWIIEKVTNAGLSYPQIKPTVSGKLISLIQSFSAPRKVKRNSKMGIKSSNRFVFSNVVLSGGEYRQRTHAVTDPKIPALTLQIPRRSTPQCLNLLPAVAGMYDVLLAVFIHSFLRERQGLPPLPVLLLGAEGHLAHRVGKHFAESLGMLKVEAYRTAQLTAARAELNRYGYPTFIEIKAPGVLASYPANNEDRVFLSAEPVSGSALLCGKSPWVVVEGYGLIRPDVQIPGSDDVLNYLRVLQLRAWEIPGKLSPTVQDVLADYLSWSSPEQPKKQEFPYLRMATSPGRAFIDLLCWLYSRQEIQTEYFSFVEEMLAVGLPYVSKHALVFDQAAQVVFINYSLVLQLLKRKGFPVPDLSPILDDLLANNLLRYQQLPLEGWVLDLPFWEASVKVWRTRLSYV